MTDRESTGAVLVDPLGGLLLDPANELRFKGPFDDYVTVSLTIKNPTDKRIAFKIKTTAPKRYCVKPNSGVLDSAQSMKVNVLLQPFQYDPNEKNKHKFMVQYLYLNNEEIQLSVNDILNMWKDVDSKRLLDLKLKCIFDFDGSGAEGQKSGTTINDTLSNASNVSSYQQAESTTKPQQKEPTPAPVASQQKTRQAKSEMVENNEPSVASSRPSNVNTSSNSPVSPVAVVPAAQKSSASSRQQSDKNDNLANELKSVQKENEALKIEVANLREAEIRLRKLALSSASATGKQAQAGGLADLLQNKLVLVITVLVAIIFYLLLFR